MRALIIVLLRSLQWRMHCRVLLHRVKTAPHSIWITFHLSILSGYGCPLTWEMIARLIILSQIHGYRCPCDTWGGISIRHDIAIVCPGYSSLPLLGLKWQLQVVHDHQFDHYNDVIMSDMASQITSLTIVYPTVYSGAHQRKHQCTASPVNSPSSRDMISFDGVIMIM